MAAEQDCNCLLLPYYRDLAVKVGVGLTPTQVMLSFMGKSGDPYSDGRQFPLQGADLPHKIIQISNVVAAGLTQAAGYALACKMAQNHTVVLTYFGDGASSQGERSSWGTGGSGAWKTRAAQIACIHVVPALYEVLMMMSSSRGVKCCQRALSMTTLW